MGREVSEPPEPVCSAIAELWRTSSETADDAFNSGAFRQLEVNCGSTYSEIEGSRLSRQPTSDWARIELRRALQNFFRWNGAPWYHGPCLDEGEASLRLHRAFLTPEVHRTYLAPLDQLGLEDRTQHPSEEVEYVCFGSNEVRLLGTADLKQRVPYEALKRFGSGYRFPAEKLDGFYWLIVSTREEAGHYRKRSPYGWLHATNINDIGQVPVFEPTYPAPIEDTFFVLLLSLIKEPSKRPWRPFAVPWIYSFTDDPFAEPDPAPDPSVLTWIPFGPPGEEVEMPDRSETFEVAQEEFETALRQRWRRLQDALARANTERANFHPLTKHFFVKAFAEGGIDQILADISSIEATLQLRGETNRRKLMKRYKALVRDTAYYQWLNCAYEKRNEYLHSIGDPRAVISWIDLARACWSVAKAVDNYLELTDTQSDLNRNALLRSLEPDVGG